MTLRFFLIDAPNIQGKSENERIFELNKFPVSIGRGANNGISLSDPTRTVSRNHALIVHSEGQVVITDLGSKNFTYLNNDRLSPEDPYELKEGDVIQCGDFTLRVDVLDTSGKGPGDYTVGDTKIGFQGYEKNPFDGVVLELIETVEQLNTIYNQITPEMRDAMLSESISRTIESIEQSNDAMQLLAESISKTGLLNKEMFMPKSSG